MNKRSLKTNQFSQRIAEEKHEFRQKITGETQISSKIKYLENMIFEGKNLQKRDFRQIPMGEKVIPPNPNYCSENCKIDVRI